MQLTDRATEKARLQNRIRLASLGAAVAVAVGVLYLQVSASDVPLNDDMAVEHASQRGEELLIDAGSRDTYYPKAWHGGKLDPAVGQAARDKVSADLSRVFSQDLVKQYSAQINAAQDRAESADPNTPEPTALTSAEIAAGQDAYPIVRLRGTLLNITFQTVTVSGDTATVVATVDATADVAQVRAGHEYVAHPHNVIVVTESLVRVANGWMITSRGQRFAPGGGP